MSETCIYHDTLSKDAAMAKQEACAGTQFDPELTNVFVGLMNGFPKHSIYIYMRF